MPVETSRPNGGTVEVLNADIQGGTLNTLNGGTLETAGSSILDGSTKDGLTLSQGSTYTGNTGTVTSVLGTITNHGTIQLVGGSNTNGYLGLNANTTLNGGGTVTISYNGSESGAAYIEQNAANLNLTNINNSIDGTGVIGNGGLTLVNQSGGTIDANRLEVVFHSSRRGVPCMTGVESRYFLRTNRHPLARVPMLLGVED
jgi:hypothetical protein